MSLTNVLNDLLITDPQVMRALAHPVRLAALTYLQQHGPATATQLSGQVGASPSVTSWHLRHLAGFGLVADADPREVGGDRRQRYWKAQASGFSLETGTDPEAQEAGRALGSELFAAAETQTGRWLTDTEPALEPQWRRLAGPSNTQVPLTTAELEDLASRVDELLAPYVRRRDEAEVPADARPVRVLRYYLPAGPG